MTKYCLWGSSRTKRQEERQTKELEKQNYQLYLRNKVPDEAEKEHVATKIFPFLFLWTYSFELISGKEPRAL